MQTMVAPIEEDLPTMTMPDCCLEPVYNWNFICLPKKRSKKSWYIIIQGQLYQWTEHSADADFFSKNVHWGREVRPPNYTPGVDFLDDDLL